MAASDALWNEVARIINIEFFDNEQPLTGVMLIEIVKYVAESLQNVNASD